MKLRFLPRSFTRLVRNWLRSIGHGYCGKCFGAIPLDLMTKTGNSPRQNSPRCKACVAAFTAQRYQADPEATRRWQRENRDKMIAYSKRWYDSHREQVRQKARERYARKHPKRRRGPAKAAREHFRGRCLVCGRSFQHLGNRTTCSDGCRLKKLRGVSK